jgi:uncharacterized protein (TIGR00661 family)
MKILYGVVGEGMGHATRSKVILTHLARRHDVKIVVSGRAFTFLRKHFQDTVEIHGLSMVYEGNRVRRSETALELLREAPDALHHNLQVLESLEHYRPDVVISDFDSFAYLFARLIEVPCLSIDNMSIIHRCDHSGVSMPASEIVNFEMARSIVSNKLPHCYHYLITTFFYPPVTAPDTSLYPPILRDAILNAKRSQGEHVLVYQTATANEDSLLKVLREAGGKYVVYGLRRNQDLGDIQLKDFSEDGFVNDLASARAVVTGGGYSLLGEAVYLRKPMLSLPVQNQFEQLLNALYLEKLEYGRYSPTLETAVLKEFLGDCDRYSRALASYDQDGNRLILEAVDRLIEEISDTAL